MSYRFNKRIKVGKGIGLNISKSGITPSYRNKKGSLSSKDYSIRTGIPSLTYRKTFSKAKNSGCLIILFTFFSVLLGISCTSVENEKTEGINSVNCRDTNCANYTSQSAAQAAYDADPECRNDLDADNDGLACEEPGNSVKNCASTSNCGCSNKNKSPCQADPCCRWVVGEGCKCG
ncbi:DUF4236 domain-containing protein [Aurantibacter crassamenti]|uniref:DUF4236 domain-containing protein n=1 Tax=Aurantibacter crassamenti TaxID=1837375 RepID=UPI00193A647F|nr:DUF4236 domain-containing protein [Aurantibacter crassamenti]MBM1105042.1 DUF4236 domain-containing protein [Aurantibacter crassamenti]